MKWLIVVIVVVAVLGVLALRMRRSSEASSARHRSPAPLPRPLGSAGAETAGEEFVSDVSAPSASETPGSPVDIERRPRT